MGRAAPAAICAPLPGFSRETDDRGWSFGLSYPYLRARGSRSSSAAIFLQYTSKLTLPLNPKPLIWFGGNGNAHPCLAPVSAATDGPVALRLPAKRDKAILAQKITILQWVKLDSVKYDANIIKKM